MKVAFLGMGTMGRFMARNVMNAGFALTVYNRTHQRCDELCAQGAAKAMTPRDAAEGAEVIITCVSDTPDVVEVLTGENGVIRSAAAGSVVVDMSTISPAVTRELAAQLAENGVKMVDAPVSGGSEGADKGTLSVMVGGEAADVERVMPVLGAMGKNIVHVGPSGAGQMTKAINQIIIAGTYWAVAEGVVLGMRAGLDMDKVVSAISGGAADSWVLNYRAKFMVNNDYPLGFRLKLHKKDLGIGLKAAEQNGVGLPLASLVDQVESALISQGHGDEDVSSMARALRRMCGID